jgi:hypothetical protein
VAEKKEKKLMLDLASKLTKRFMEAETRRKAKIAAADKEWGEAEMAALHTHAEAMKTLVSTREAAAGARATKIAEATSTFNDEAMSASADFSGQTTARLAAHEKTVLEAEKPLNGDPEPQKKPAPQIRSEPEAEADGMADRVVALNRAPTLEETA